MEKSQTIRKKIVFAKEIATVAVRPWGQCGGKGHDCARDAACSPCKRHPRNGRQFTCKRGNEWYWQCKP